MSYLSWISDAKLYSAVDTLLERCAKARDEAGTKVHKTIIYPFFCLTVASTFKVQITNNPLDLQKSGVIYKVRQHHWISEYIRDIIRKHSRRRQYETTIHQSLPVPQVLP